MPQIFTQVKSDNVFIAKYRERQAQYRENVLEEACGFGPNEDSTTNYGNYITNGKVTGKNFVSSTAFFAISKLITCH